MDAQRNVEDREQAFASEQVLGLAFFNGTVEHAVARITESGGLLVAPSGTCFERFLEDEEYRRALLTADVVLPDSGLMVTLWRILRNRKLNRISGFTYLKQLLATLDREARICWVLPNEQSRVKLQQWATATGRGIDPADCYVAPIYGAQVKDEALFGLLESHHPRNVVIAIGAGAQEKLGWYLREHVSVRPAIHCIGGALGFLTGDQVAIPDWADRIYLGWFLRLLRNPRVFVPRLWKARVLPILLLKYGQELPPVRAELGNR